MAPLITLLLGTIAARGIGWLGWSSQGYVNSWTAALAVGLAAMFMLTGFAHFAPALRRDLIAIVPPRLPAPGHLVTITACWNCWAPRGCWYPRPGWRRPSACWC